MKKFGLIGKNISYSESKNIFNSYNFDDASYDIYDVDIIDKDFLKTLDGFNVTTPYKVEIIKYLDGLSPTVKEIGSVNCVVNINGELIGYNTDLLGFECLINKDVKNILLLGNGGVSKMVQYFCKLNNINLTIVGRENSNGYKDISYNELSELSKYDCVINATKFNHVPDIDYTKIRKDAYIIDLAYSLSEKTNFLKMFTTQTNVKDGYEMLKKQAYYSYKNWNLLK